MAGGGNRREEGSITIQSTNLFAALDTRKKKKKSDKAGKSKDSSKSSSGQESQKPEPQVFWAPSPLKVKSWADINDEDDDDDYYATTAPPQPGWSNPESSHTDSKDIHVEESESEEDILGEGDDDVEEEHEHEQVHPEPEPEVKKAPEVHAPLKEAERQLSKEERKKKKLAELEALLADFGVAPKETNGQDGSQDARQEKREDVSVDGEKENAAGEESKTSKKKKKKDKQKEVKESQEQQANNNMDAVDEAAGSEPTEEESSLDVKERLKKLASMKKKKSSKEVDAVRTGLSTPGGTDRFLCSGLLIDEQGLVNDVFVFVTGPLIGLPTYPLFGIKSIHSSELQLEIMRSENVVFEILVQSPIKPR